MKCLIIAAGLGSRLSDKGDSKPLVMLHGVSLIEHVIMTAMQSDVTEFYIVIGYNGDKIKKYLSEASSVRSVKINYIYNKDWEKPNGISVLVAKEIIKEPFLLLMSDHLFDPLIIKRLQIEGVEAGEVKLAVDKRINDNGLIDIEDVTKVLEKDGLINDIGKAISDYNAFDTGIFLCSNSIFKALEKSVIKGDSSLSGGIRELSFEGKAKTFDIGDHNWIDVDDENAFCKAERVFNKI